jgi:hypothetical protein
MCLEQLLSHQSVRDQDHAEPDKDREASAIANDLDGATASALASF